jgi:polyferredoxin
MAVVSAIMLTALLLRSDLDVNVLRDRNPLFVRLSDGGVRNGYTLKLMNKLYAPRALSLGLEGLPGAKLSVVGLDNDINPIVTVPPDELKSVRLYVNLDKQSVAALGGAPSSFDIVITDVATAERMEHSAIFQGP